MTPKKMIAYLDKIIFCLFLAKCYAYDPFTGLGKQVGDCFPLVHHKECNTPLYEVYQTKTEQIGDNPPETKILLFTPDNLEKAVPLHKCGGKLPPNSGFNPKLDTIAISHGWLDGLCRTAWMRELKTQLFLRGPYNIILLDFTWGNTPDPGAAAQNALVAGEQLSFVIINIMKDYGVNGDKFHFIGHSYGTYLVGIAAKHIKDDNEKNIIRRLTFLDPAVAPVDEEDLKTGKLSKNNAKFVDVIHSDGGTCFPFNFGLIYGLGDVDFYPNGGSIQPSCLEYGISTVLRLDLFYGLLSLVPMFCYHLQAIQFFKVSINSGPKFIGARCDNYVDFLSGTCERCCRDNSSDCAVAGMDAEYYFNHKDEPRKTRTYYFNTDLVCPYNEDYEFSIFKDCKDTGPGLGKFL